MYKDVMGRFRTKSLFFETSDKHMRAKYEVPFSLKETDWEVDGKLYRSMRILYLSHRDPTEYKFAIEALGSWDHWVELRKSMFFQSYYEKWRAELEIMIQSQGIAAMLEEVATKGRSAVSSAKWLAERGWADDDKRGRPDKNKVMKEARKLHTQMGEVDEFLEHAERIQH